MIIYNDKIRSNVPLLALGCSTLVCILVSVYSLRSGYTIIFQNLFYIPIILACVFYTWRGFFFSCLLAVTYLFLMVQFSPDSMILLQAGIRVIIFVAIALVVTVLAVSGKKYEDRLRTLSEFQSTIITNARVWLIVLDPKGKVLLWNKAAEEISGYRTEEVAGKNEIWKWLYPDKEYRKKITDTISRIISTSSYLENFETTIRSKSGIEKIISWNTKGISKGSGKFYEYIAIGIDVTDRHHIEEELLHQTTFLQVLIDTLPFPIFYKNREGVYTGCNTAFEHMTGSSRAQVIGKTVYNLWPHDMAEVYHTADIEVFNSPHVQQYETSMKHADGSVHQVMFYKAPYYDEKNQVTGLIGAILDITERKQGEEALRESNQKLRLLTSLTRHDLLNRLSAIQLLHQLTLNSSDITNIHSYISRALEADASIEEIIGFTREYEYFGTISSGWQHLRQIIDAAMNEVPLGGVIAENQVPADLDIYADPIIRKVFATLIENALRHGESVSHIRFFSIHKDSKLIIVCEDDGVGIPMKEKEIIFDHGYGKHTGIGLFLSQEILSITGLSIRENGEPGNGARFEILIPEGKYRDMN